MQQPPGRPRPCEAGAPLGQGVCRLGLEARGVPQTHPGTGWGVWWGSRWLSQRLVQAGVLGGVGGAALGGFEGFRAGGSWVRWRLVQPLRPMRLSLESAWSRLPGTQKAVSGQRLGGEGA